MSGFDGVIAMVDADVHGFAHPFWLILENLRSLLVKNFRDFVLPSQVSNLGG